MIIFVLFESHGMQKYVFGVIGHSMCVTGEMPLNHMFIFERTMLNL